MARIPPSCATGGPEAWYLDDPAAHIFVPVKSVWTRIEGPVAVQLRCAAAGIDISVALPQLCISKRGLCRRWDASCEGT